MATSYRAAVLLACLLACAAAGTAAAAAGDGRHVVTFAPGSEAAIEAQLPELGVTVVGRGPGFLVVQGPPRVGGNKMGAAALFSNAKEAAYVDARAQSLSALNGVTGVQADTHAAAPDGRLTDDAALPAHEDAGETRNEWLEGIKKRTNPPECAMSDKPVGDGPMPEIEAYWREQVQANAPVLKEAVPRTVGRGVLICIIDSGVDAGHPEFAGGPDSLDGCKEEDSMAPAGCPFKWSQDLTGHGTHVSGIIAAPRNGRGVVGVIPGGADMYYVRVFNNSGDVNQGQGFVYGSSLILAYTQCEGKLAYLRAADPRKNWRMVVSMSVGAPGPLTIEKLFFEEATKRDDMLFVASSGNNGTDEEQWLNFPSAYEGVMSVGAVNCKNEVQPWSQRNARVDIVAPGADILSTYPVWKAARAGATAGYFAYGSASFNTPPGAYFSGLGSLKAPLVDCGTGSKPCPEAEGAVCMVQSAPKKTTSENGTQGMVMPSICSMVKYCLDAGARGVLLVPPESIPDFGPFPRNVVSAPNLDCSLNGKTPCKCWTETLEPLQKSGKMPPVVALTLDQAAKLQEEAKALHASGKSTEAFLKTELAPYRRMSGTSMATPIVSGIAARVWAQFPACTSHDIRRALETTAKDLGPRGWDAASGFGLVQAEAAFSWLAQQPCAAVSPVAAEPVPAPGAAAGGRRAAGKTAASAPTWNKGVEGTAAAPPAPVEVAADKQAAPRPVVAPVVDHIQAVVAQGILGHA